MSAIKCKMCGGDLDIVEGSTVAECEYCGSRQTIPNQDNEKKLTLFARADRLRRACEFDKAAGVYESIVADFPEEAEAYWGLVLCRYGIEYVDDPATGKKVPTCHRSSFDSILEDLDFEKACDHADPIAWRLYRDEAKTIERILEQIQEASAKEEPYDIFICYKETDENSERTIDSVIAQDVYDALTEKGYRVFFSRISLEDKLGMEYESYIFAALNSAKIMLVFGTNLEHFNAVWVKNEWSRFLKLMARDKSRHLIPCYMVMDAYGMPKEFARLQAQDMGKVGAIQDLLRGIDKIVSASTQTGQGGKRENPQGYSEADKEALKDIQRGIFKLEDGLFDEAYDCFKEAEYGVDSDEVSSYAHLGQLCAQLGIRSIEEFEGGDPPLPDRRDYELYACAADVKAGYILLSRKEWASANKFFDSALETNPEYAPAYIGKMMVDHRIPKEADIPNLFHGDDLTTDKNYKRAWRFADDSLRQKLDGFAKALDAAVKEFERQEQEEKRQWQEEENRRLAEIKRKQKSMVSRRIAADGLLCAGVRVDGAVMAVGRDYKNGYSILPWTDVVAVATGGHHIVGLRKDGTVVAAGQNKSHQCDVSGWTDIIAVDAGWGFTIGLKRDGTVKFAGEERVSGVSKWTDIVSIAAAHSKSVVGVRRDGTVLHTYYATSQVHGSLDRWKNIVAVTIGGIGTFGLRSDGTVIATDTIKSCVDEVFFWKDIVAIAAGDKIVVGLKLDGTAVAHSYDRYIQEDVHKWTNIVAVAAEGENAVGLCSNGTCVSAGYVDAVHKFKEHKWKFFNNIDTLPQEIEDKRLHARVALESERASLQTELSTLKGLFAGKRRKEIETRLAYVETKLKNL